MTGKAHPKKDPKRWGTDITQVAQVAFPDARFPVKVDELAKLYSGQLDPTDPILEIRGDDLPRFEGGLYPIGKPRRGWCVLYNDRVKSTGRRRFTIAHEFGHWLMHRHLIPPGGISCDEKSVIQRAGGTDIEKEADTFAAYLLMPFDIFRERIPSTSKPTLTSLFETAEFFGVSPTAAILRWLEYTELRAIMIASRDGGMLWAKSSDAAFKSGAFFRTKQETQFVPESSMVGQQQFNERSFAGVGHPAGVWFEDEPAIEMTAYMELFETAITVLILDGYAPKRWSKSNF